MTDNMQTDQSLSTFPIYSARQRKALEVFVCMLLISLLLHGALSVFVLIPARNMVQGREPIYVDLGAISPPSAPVAPTAPTDPVDDEAEPVPETPVTDTPVPPVTESERLQKTVSDTLQQAATTPEAVHQSSIGLGITSGYFGSFAEGATLKDDIREYYFSLMRRINEVWWTNNVSHTAFRGATLILVINREGKFVACELMESTGNPQNDKLLLESLKLAEPFPPLPASYVGATFNTPIRFVPPLNLMLPSFLRKPAAPHM